MGANLFYGFNGDGNITATVGTAFQYVVPPAPDKAGKALLLGLDILDSGTAETITLMRSLGRTSANGANAAGQAVLNVVANPGPSGDLLVANDYLCLRELDGITRLYQLSSISSLALTLTTNLVKGTNGGESLWMVGVTGDTDPRSGNPHPVLKSNSNSTDKLFPAATDTAIVGSYAIDEPIVVWVNNITNVAIVRQLSWAYSPT